LPRRIALIGYPPDYFQPFGKALEEAGLVPFWVHSSRSAAERHARLGVAAERALDSTAGFSPTVDAAGIERARAELAKLESVVRRLLGAVPVVADDPNGGGR